MITAPISSGNSGGVGGAYHLRAEHHRGVVLGDHEAGADRADAEAEQ
jgi:hypothetical protein